MNGSAPRIEDLQWLRALAARLVRDPHRADDAVQDTLVAALEHGPKPAVPRAWLAAALRNFVRQEWRGRVRRAAREAAVSAPREQPSPLEVLEELALHRRLADEVHALAEPYRTAVLLRYLRARSSEQIALELGVPVKTVRTRLERGIAKLRARLGRDRAAWALLLTGLPAPLPSPAPLPPSVPWPALLVSMNVKIAGSFAALALVGAFLVLREQSDAPVQTPVSPALAQGPLTPAPARATAAPGVRAPAPESGTDAAASEAAPDRSAPAGPVLRGFVRTLDGSGLAGVGVVLEPLRGERFEASTESPRTRSTAGGRFELPLAAPRGRLNVEDVELAAVVTPHLEGALPLTEPILVVAPSRTWAGLVVDPDGLPIPHARIEVTLDGPFVQSRDVGGTSLHLLLPFAEAESDARGAFRIERAGFVPEAFLAARADGFEPWRGALPVQSDERLEIVLRPSTEPRQIHGLVLEASGVPAPGAQVSLGNAFATCDARGRFVLACEEWRASGWLRAVRRGQLPAEVTLSDALASTSERPVVLTLGPAPLALRGRVLDEHGAPVAGATVFSPDTTPFGLVEFQQDAHAFQGLTTVEAFLAGSRQHPWEALPNATTDADGRFELMGLLARDYGVFALDAHTLDGVGPVFLRAGSADGELRLVCAARVRVAGRVLSRAGLPLAGVRVRPGRALDWRPDDGEGSRWTGYPLRAPAATRLLSERARTDADGRFDLGELVPHGTYLSLVGEALALGATFELATARDPGALEVVVDAASRFQVVPRLAHGADAFGLETPDGEQVVLLLEVEGLRMTTLRATIEGGRSGVVLAQEGEYELVLYAGDEERLREPVRLLPGGVHALTP